MRTPDVETTGGKTMTEQKVIEIIAGIVCKTCPAHANHIMCATHHKRCYAMYQEQAKAIMVEHLKDVAEAAEPESYVGKWQPWHEIQSGRHRTLDHA